MAEAIPSFLAIRLGEKENKAISRRVSEDALSAAAAAYMLPPGDGLIFWHYFFFLVFKTSARSLSST